MGLSFGGTDLGEEVGYRRQSVGEEWRLLLTRNRARFRRPSQRADRARAPLIAYDDPEGTYEQANWACRLGFDAKCCIFPYQVDVVNRAFGPSQVELEWAQRLTSLIESGVMPDEDYGFVKRARRIIAEDAARR